MFRKFYFVFLLFSVAVFLSGCGNNPDSLFKKGKYSEAYTEFIKRGGMNEAALKTEVMNGSFDSRNNAGNQAIHDYYYAAECQKKLGNTALAQSYYQKVVDLSKYQIRIPKNQCEQVKNAYEYFLNCVRNFRDREIQLTQYSSSNTDPYSNSQTYSPDSLYQMYYNNMISARREFERLLYSTTADQMPAIADIKREYNYYVGPSFDSYLRAVAPGGYLVRPDAGYSRYAYNAFADDSSAFQRTLYSAQTITTYSTYNLRLKEPNLVAQAQSELGIGASAPVEPPSQATPTSQTGQTPMPQSGTGDLAKAEKEMREAYQRYQDLIMSKASAGEIQRAAEEYQVAKKIYEILKAR